MPLPSICWFCFRIINLIIRVTGMRERARRQISGSFFGLHEPVVTVLAVIRCTTSAGARFIRMRHSSGPASLLNDNFRSITPLGGMHVPRSSPMPHGILQPRNLEITSASVIPCILWLRYRYVHACIFDVDLCACARYWMRSGRRFFRVVLEISLVLVRKSN